MRYIQVLEEILPKVFDEVEQDILNEDKTASFIKNKKLLKQLIDEQKDLITEYLKSFPESSQLNREKIKQLYHRMEIPYIIVSRNIELIKTRLLERVSIEKEINSKEFLLQLKEYIEQLENIIAKEYIKNEIYQLENIENSVFKEFLLYKAHIPYIKKIVKAIKEDKLDEFPLEDAKSCDFQKYLFYPESIMACMDANLCRYIENLHSIIHEMANSFFVFYMNRKYKDAYIAFKEFSNNIFKLAKVLSELYFSTYADAETNLFKLTKYMEEIFDRGILFLIDVKNLRGLNKIYSESKVNKILKQIDNTLHEYLKDKRKNFLYVKGSTANFYMFAVDIDNKKLEKTVQDIKKLVEKSYRLNGHSTDIKVTISAMELDKYSENTYEDLVKILHHLKEKAKSTSNSVYIVVSEEDKEEIRQWLNKIYRDSAYIKSKLDKKEVDVVFQPIYDVVSKQIKHLEVLARIKDSEDKLIPAGVFIDLIYDFGLISQLDSTVLEKVLEKKGFIKKVSDSLFLNISSESLTSKEFLENLSVFLDSMKDFYITFEITEQRLIEDISILKDIHMENKKIHIAIDDFGTGYSSLRVVADLAEKGILDVVKIDGTLIKEIAHRKFIKKVVKAISSMSQNLGVETVAEFVENDSILEVLGEVGIKNAQGYYLSKPKKIEELIIEKQNLKAFI
ncbi:EAL domain, c-di-GMP-specific phosphodiesterase class I (or its enzymatically inactive variant) [Persephonella hydrogeniphila]|uniref:EAL domain, c-di-GMP-specific phosphodiesterase class I (Or its enzymatically inactive variant) n=1 Tax=Persephonella hydrogeniphila TaxID=198703 RepID=A0A285NGB7_9AQUI|nr:EAL domain-containing protein [Persephonella hydrogeniphila]SNZ08552.1 EAL domain, c-di-GMP-specific phosphodiesterase class I (or its enzymatically inactive variant) [Persephonella hydrogeniphila]